MNVFNIQAFWEENNKRYSEIDFQSGLNSFNRITIIGLWVDDNVTWVDEYVYWYAFTFDGE